MFNFIKELLLIGQVSSVLGRVVKGLCGTDYIDGMSTKQQNMMASDTIKMVEKIQGKKFGEIDDSNIQDMVVIGLVRLAEELGTKNALDQKMVLMGLMKYIALTQKEEKKVSLDALLFAQKYCEEHRVR